MKKLFMMTVVKPWPRLPGEVGDAPPLEMFKARLDGALSNLDWLKMSLLAAGKLDWVALKGPFQPKPFHDSMKSFICLSCWQRVMRLYGRTVCWWDRIV